LKRLKKDARIMVRRLPIARCLSRGCLNRRLRGGPIRNGRSKLSMNT